MYKKLCRNADQRVIMIIYVWVYVCITMLTSNKIMKSAMSEPKRITYTI